MEQKPRKRAPGAGRKPKVAEARYPRRTITLPPELDSAVLAQQQGNETFSATLARLLASHPAIAKEPQQKRPEQRQTPPATVELDQWRMLSDEVIDSTGKVTEYYMQAPDGWETKKYRTKEKALAEAKRRVLSQPKALISHVRNEYQSYDQVRALIKAINHETSEYDTPIDSEEAIYFRGISMGHKQVIARLEALLRNEGHS